MEATTLARAGYAVSVICPTGKGFEADYEEIDGIAVYRHPLPPEKSSSAGYLKEYYSALRWEFKLAKRAWKKQGGFDVIHICNPPDLLFLVALRYKLFRGVRVIFDQHDLNPELYEAKFGRRDFFYYGLRWAEKLTFKTADAVISTNESYRQIALQRGGKSPDRVFIVRSGPDLSRFAETGPNPAYRGGKRYLVGYVGVMGEQEGIDLLIAAVRHLVRERQRSDIRFMLIGGGPAVPALKELVDRFGLAEYIEFTGRIPDAELVERLSSCDLCVNPDPKTPFNDCSTMNKILEYMALSKPIVQFDLTEGRRSAGTASEYAKPNDPLDFARLIVELLDDPEKRQSMGKTGRRLMSESLEWRHQASKLLQAYDTAIAGRRSKADRESTVNAGGELR